MKATDMQVDLASLVAVFKDVAAWVPGLRPDLDRDLVRVQETITHRGLSFLVKDMPDAGKVFDLALSNGRIFPTSLPHTFGRVQLGYSRQFLHCLFELVFDGSGFVLDDADPTAVFFIRQVLYLYKELDAECPPELVQVEVDEFHKIEEEMRAPTLSWDSDWLDPDPNLHFLDGHRRTPDMISHRDICPRGILRILQQVCDRVVTRFPVIDIKDLHPRHGPGAVSDMKTGGDKYTLEWWPAKLDHHFPYAYFCMHREDLMFEEAREWTNREHPARLIAVPKTPLKPRLIASEPRCHQYCQQSLMKWFRSNLPTLLRHSIDFTSQEPSRMAVIQASITGESASVDLKSASDRLSCWFVERMFRRHPDILGYLHAVRTRWMVDPISSPQRFRILRKYANQGSSVTFTLQSISYWCCCVASYLFERKMRVTSSNLKKAGGSVRIYGDDIVVPRDVVPALTVLLDHLGLRVNMKKTHVGGNFRESCGMDAYKGYDVSPLHLSYLRLEEQLKFVPSWIDISNNAYRKGLWHLSEWMLSQVPKEILNKIPISDKEQSCIALATYQEGLVSKSKKFSKELQTTLILGFQVQDQTVQGERATSQNLLQSFVEGRRGEQSWKDFLFPGHGSEKAVGFTVKRRSRIRKRWVPAIL